MTAATPMMMPSMVSELRSLFTRSERSAMRTACTRSRQHLFVHGSAASVAAASCGVRAPLVVSSRPSRKTSRGWHSARCRARA
jgi:hypothetical protein